MRKAILLILACLFAPQAWAQSTVRVGGTGSGGVTKNTTAQQDTDNATARDRDNAGICLGHGLAKTCTQAQLDAVSGCSGGACGTIYATTATGAGQYGLDSMFACHFERVAAKIQDVAKADIAAQVLINGATIDTNTNCTNAGLANGCTRLQVACRYLTGSTSGTDCKP